MTRVNFSAEINLEVEGENPEGQLIKALKVRGFEVSYPIYAGQPFIIRIPSKDELQHHDSNSATGEAK